MAVAVMSTALLGSKASNGHVGTLLTIGSKQTATLGSCVHMAFSSRQPFQSCVRTNAAKSSPGVKASAGKPQVGRPHASVGSSLQVEANEAVEMKPLIEEVRGMFRRMTEGEITVSPYDTAWVALVPAFDGSAGPQFPKSLQWLLDNQLADGSWGFSDYFSYIDRVFNTLACIVALKTWNTGSEPAIERGVRFIQENLHAMETEEKSHMLLGFEVVFPPLVASAQKLGLDLPYDAPVISTMASLRQKILKKVPMDIVHKVPTHLLYSLEGIHDEVDWEKIMKFQDEDGSFLTSPASTAACLLHTRDEKALGYLNRLLDRFDNAVSNVFPVDMFERMWMVDRLQRLGIDRHFEREIKACLDYVYKYFSSSGTGWARASAGLDLDDTIMGFRLLRQHGYDISENVIRPYSGKDKEFFNFQGQVGGFGPTGLFNIYRAAQIRFPGETLLASAEKFSQSRLADLVEKNEFFDKWVILKDIAGEVDYALKTPWYCSLPQIETEAYLKQYGTNDIWIGKVLYRMPNVHNEKFLALAKADFNLSQAMHQLDLQEIVRWNEDCGFGKLTFTREKPYEAFFLAACVFPYPELAPARSVWARQRVLTTVVEDFFDIEGTLPDLRRFVAAAREWDPSLMNGTVEEAQIVFNGLYNSINAINTEGWLAQGRDIGQHIKKILLRWLESMLTEAERTASGVWPSFDEYLETALPSIALEPIVVCTSFFLGDRFSDELMNDSKQLLLMDLVNHIGRFLRDFHGQKRDESEGKANAVSILLHENPDWTEEEAISRVKAMVEESMQELVREVHSPSHIPKSIRHAHFNMARTMHLLYQKTDSFTDFSASMAKKMDKILFQHVL